MIQLVEYGVKPEQIAMIVAEIKKPIKEWSAVISIDAQLNWLIIAIQSLFQGQLSIK
jgi:hypothetical protein